MSEKTMEDQLNSLHAAGWSVGVHNDYRLGGERHSFWLFTRGNCCIKGEASSDEAALSICRDEWERLDRRGSFQAKVGEWLRACFGARHALDRVERTHRFLEEALELAQARGCERGEAHQLVEYVFDRPAGLVEQEVGGVMLTLAGVCLTNGVDMMEAAEKEQSRVWDKIATIREKQANKPERSALPQYTNLAPSQAILDVVAERGRQIDVEGWTAEHDDQHTFGELAGAAACYAMHEVMKRRPIGFVQDVFKALWPFALAWWKPKDERRNLVKAAALLIAEIERRDRIASKRGNGAR